MLSRLYPGKALVAGVTLKCITLYIGRVTIFREFRADLRKLCFLPKKFYNLRKTRNLTKFQPKKLQKLQVETLVNITQNLVKVKNSILLQHLLVIMEDDKHETLADTDGVGYEKTPSP